MTMPDLKIKVLNRDDVIFSLPTHWMGFEADQPLVEKLILQQHCDRMVYLEAKHCSDRELAELEALKKHYGMMPQYARLVQKPITPLT